jgi:hypothetical protein
VIHCEVAEELGRWTAKKEQEKMLKLHWAMLGRLQNAGVTLAEVIGQYHT